MPPTASAVVLFSPIPLPWQMEGCFDLQQLQTRRFHEFLEKTYALHQPVEPMMGASRELLPADLHWQALQLLSTSGIDHIC